MRRRPSRSLQGPRSDRPCLFGTQNPVALSQGSDLQGARQLRHIQEERELEAMRGPWIDVGGRADLPARYTAYRRQGLLERVEGLRQRQCGALVLIRSGRQRKSPAPCQWLIDKPHLPARAGHLLVQPVPAFTVDFRTRLEVDRYALDQGVLDGCRQLESDTGRELQLATLSQNPELRDLRTLGLRLCLRRPHRAQQHAAQQHDQLQAQAFPTTRNKSHLAH